MKKMIIVLLATLAFASCSTTKDIETRIAAIEDRFTIEEVVQDLFNGTDDLDWGRVESAFADELLFDMTALAGGEPTVLKGSDITSAWDRGLGGLEAIHHQIGQVTVDVQGEKATVFCYGTASHYLPTEGSGNTRAFVGVYDLELEKIDGQWRITLFRFIPKFIDGNVNLGA